MNFLERHHNPLIQNLQAQKKNIAHSSNKQPGEVARHHLHFGTKIAQLVTVKLKEVRKLPKFGLNHQLQKIAEWKKLLKIRQNLLQVTIKISSNSKRTIARKQTLF
jgi:hypothetical protein